MVGVSIIRATLLIGAIASIIQIKADNVAIWRRIKKIFNSDRLLNTEPH